MNRKYIVLDNNRPFMVMIYFVHTASERMRKMDDEMGTYI